MERLGLVIPAYNAHDTITRLLHSICLFDFVEDVRILLVDDCSDKRYDYLVGQFPELEMEILRLEENKGPGYARNIGIDWSIEKGLEFLCFADADDYFVSTNFWSKINDEERQSNDLFVFNFYDASAQSNIRDLDVWSFGKIYKVSILKKSGVRFSENYSNEDVVLNFIYLSLVNSAYVSDECIYYWYKREGSLSRSEDYVYKSLPELSKNLVKAFKRHKVDILPERIKPMIINRMVRLYYHFNELCFSHQELIEAGEENEIIQSIKYFYDNCYEQIEDKISLEDILREFGEINRGNDFVSGFMWIDYFSFLKKVK